jgi:chemotaxis regulatin CheY-phosphate phosphatase CheZ
MESKISEKTANADRNIHAELQELAAAIGEIVSNIKAAHQPIEESRSRVPEATQQLERITKQTEDATHRVLDMVESITNRESDVETLLKRLRRVLPSTYFRNNSRVRRILEEVATKVADNQSDAFMIMDALQFQDITAQQVEHAMTVLELVQKRLHDALASFGESNLDQPETPQRKRAYDPNAHYSSDFKGQSGVDELLDNLRGKND